MTSHSMGAAVLVFFAATGVMDFLTVDAPQEVEERVVSIEATRWTAEDHQAFALDQMEVDLKQDLAIMRLEAKLDELLKEMQK